MATTSHILYQAPDSSKGYECIEPRLMLLARFVSTGRWYVDTLEHDFYTISFVQQGHASVFVDDELYRVTPGSMLLYSPHCPYHAHNDEPYMDYHTLIFRFTLGDQTRLPARFAASSTLAVARLLNMIHKQVTQETPDQRTIKTLLLEIMEHAHHPKHAALRHPQAGRVLDAMQLIRKQLGQPFSLASLAKQLHCSPSHLSHLFKQHADTSAGAYYLSLKMDHAKQLLCDPASSLKQVAEQMGYATIHQFTRRFTAVVGIPPGEFRKQQLQVDAQRVRVVSTDGGPVA